MKSATTIDLHLSEVPCLQADDITDGMYPLPAVYRRMFKRQTVIFAEHFGANPMFYMMNGCKMMMH